MIVLISGVPGSGKTYYAVKQISDILKDKDSIVFSNIENFRFERFRVLYSYYVNKLTDGFLTNLECGQYVDITKDLITLGASFFTVDNYKKLIKKYSLEDKKVYFFIDECQRFFPSFLKDTDIIYFFDYHRHFGLNIFLITQDSVKISSSIASLAEFEVRASPPMLRFKNVFIYKKIINGEILNRFVLKFNNKIACLYTTAYFTNNVNFNNTIALFFAVPVLFIVAVFVFIYFLTHFKI